MPFKPSGVVVTTSCNFASSFPHLLYSETFFFLFFFFCWVDASSALYTGETFLLYGQNFIAENKNLSTGAVASLVWLVVSWKLLLLLLVKRLLPKTFGGNEWAIKMHSFAHRSLWYKAVDYIANNPFIRLEIPFSMTKYRGGEHQCYMLCVVDRSQSARNEGYVLIQSTKYLLSICLKTGARSL